MQIAVKYGWIDHAPLVDDAGNLVAEGGGMTLVARLLRMYPGAVLIGPARRQCTGFEMVPLTEIDESQTLVVNMDVIDSIQVFQILHEPGNEPKIMNFQWASPSIYHHPVNFAAMGMSYALFPTFCSGSRTAGEVHEICQKWVVSPLAKRAQVAWADLGVFPDRVHPRAQSEIPVVLYPAIYLSERKQPNRFIGIVERVQKRTPLVVDMKLAQTHLISQLAMDISRRPWVDMGPLTSQRDDYWGRLAHTTAFLATATEEAYGIEYLEALFAGAIGVFPDLPWARALLPEKYPFLYSSDRQAEDQLHHVVSEPDTARASLDACVGGSFADWIRSHHAMTDFENKFRDQVAAWFPDFATSNAA